MKILLTYQIVAFMCYSPKAQIPNSSKEVIMVLPELHAIGDPLDIDLRMPVLPPLPPIISPNPVTNVNP
jgi:hypothetical protein